MIEGMVARGYERDFAERCFQPDRGLRRIRLSGKPRRELRPPRLCLGLDQVPLPRRLLRRAPQRAADGLLRPRPARPRRRAPRRRGAAAVDINFSDWDSTLEDAHLALVGEASHRRWRRDCATRHGTVELTARPRSRIPRHEGAGVQRPRSTPPRRDADDIRSTHAVRLGFRQIKGFREDDAERLVAARGKGYDSVRDLWLRSGLPRAAIERLADADAFRSLGLDRRDALWAARALGGGRPTDRLPLFDVRGARRHPPRAGFRPAADAARRACRQRLPLSQPVAEGASGLVPPPRARRARASSPARRLRDDARTASASPSPASSSSASGRARRAASSS